MDPEKVERSYARTGHYNGIINNRTNFEVITESKVTKILFDEEDGASGVVVAKGVSFRHKSGNSTVDTVVKANKEVILSAGAIHSPQLLQQSGVGPAKLLKSAGIDTIVDLPGVGQNFQDHPTVFTNVICKSIVSRHAHATPAYKWGYSAELHCPSESV